LVLADDGEFAGAGAQLVEAISLAPLEQQFYISLGRVWRISSQPQRARLAFERALELDPANTAAAAELRNLPEKSSTTVAEDQFLFGAPVNMPEAHFAFASVLGMRSDWMGAVGEWLRVLAFQPANVGARNNLGVSYAHLARDENAELEFRKALAVANDSPGAHFGLAVIEMQQGKSVDAAQELREVLRIQPNYPQARNLLSAALR
jgi:Flp pilus assembly protein TadD